MADQDQINSIIAKHINNEPITSEEQAVLNEWLSVKMNKNVLESLKSYHQIDPELPLKKLHFERGKADSRGKLRGLRPSWSRYMSAAMILLVAMAGYLWYSSSTKYVKQPQVDNRVSIHDISPANGEVVLSLADGRQLNLDSVADGEIEGLRTINKKPGQISYLNNGQSVDKSRLFNILSTKKGKQYAIVLADGSKVWLNAESSLRYPVEFSGNERRVELIGEAYFEIEKAVSKNDKRIPFLVNINGAEIEVLGTHFNIKAYPNERVKTTLVEGSVKVIPMGNTAKVLKPGQQAMLGISNTVSIKVEDNADMEEVTAWRKGDFKFRGSTIQDIMKEVERWYDVEVVIEDTLANLFVVDIPRSKSLLSVVKMLEMTEVIDVTTQDKKLIIRKK